MTSETRILWRATRDGATHLRQHESAAADPETAEAYQDDPGFGGPCLYRVEIAAPAHILDLRGERLDIEAALDAAGIGDEDERDRIQSQGYASVGVLLAAERAVREALAAEYDWIRYTDDFPTGAETWWYLGTEPVPMQATT